MCTHACNILQSYTWSCTRLPVVWQSISIVTMHTQERSTPLHWSALQHRVATSHRATHTLRDLEKYACFERERYYIEHKEWPRPKRMCSVYVLVRLIRPPTRNEDSPPLSLSLSPPSLFVFFSATPSIHPIFTTCISVDIYVPSYSTSFLLSLFMSRILSVSLLPFSLQ